MATTRRTQVKRLTKWVEALRSGKYRQGRGQLQTAGRYCCLGVACRALPRMPRPDTREDGRFDDVQLNGVQLDYLGLEYHEQHALINANDGERRSFRYIADMIEDTIIPRVAEGA